MILPYVFCFLGLCSLTAAVILSIISAGFRRSNTLQTTGYLEKTNTQHNVYIGGKDGRWYKNCIPSFFHTIFIVIYLSTQFRDSDR